MWGGYVQLRGGGMDWKKFWGRLHTDRGTSQGNFWGTGKGGLGLICFGVFIEIGDDAKCLGVGGAKGKRKEEGDGTRKRGTGKKTNCCGRRLGRGSGMEGRGEGIKFIYDNHSCLTFTYTAFFRVHSLPDQNLNVEILYKLFINFNFVEEYLQKKIEWFFFAFL